MKSTMTVQYNAILVGGKMTFPSQSGGRNYLQVIMY